MRNRWCTSPLLLTIEYAEYSLSLQWRRQPTSCRLNHNRVRRVVLLSSLSWSTYHTSHPLSCKQATSSIMKMRSTLHTPFQGGEEEYTAYSSSPPPLHLAIKYTACFFPSYTWWWPRSRPPPPLWGKRWRVHGALHHVPPLLLTMEYVYGVRVVFLVLYLASTLCTPWKGWGVGCVHYHKEERKNTLPTPPLLLVIEYTAYSSSSCIWWRTRSRPPPPLQGRVRYVLNSVQDNDEYTTHSITL